VKIRRRDRPPAQVGEALRKTESPAVEAEAAQIHARFLGVLSEAKDELGEPGLEEPELGASFAGLLGVSVKVAEASAAKLLEFAGMRAPPLPEESLLGELAGRKIVPLVSHR
jgi:hypothetical protein